MDEKLTIGTELARPIGILVLIVGMLLIVLPLVNVPHTVSEAHDVQKPTIVMDQTFVVPPSNNTVRSKYLLYGDLLNIQVTVTSSGNEGIDFSIDSTWPTRREISHSGITSVDRNWTAPDSEYYNFIYDNNSSLTPKSVTVKVVEYNTETAYRSVIRISPLLPLEFAYLGVIVAFTGIGLIFLARIESNRTPHIIRKG